MLTRFNPHRAQRLFDRLNRNEPIPPPTGGWHDDDLWLVAGVFVTEAMRRRLHAGEIPLVRDVPLDEQPKLAEAISADLCDMLRAVTVLATDVWAGKYEHDGDVLIQANSRDDGGFDMVVCNST